jgi:hypothetical protein
MELVLWVNNDLTAFVGGTLPEGISGLDGYSQSDNSQHVNFIEGNGHIHELYRNPDPAAQWVDNDLTKFAKANTAFSPALVGYSQNDNSQHVISIDDTGHVHELYRNPDPAAQWVDNDLTKFARGTPATVFAAPSALAGYLQNDNSQHVIFIDSRPNVHELYRSSDPAAQWVDNDLTFFASGTSPVISSALAGYSQSDNSQHVNFIDVKGHVHELYRNPAPAAQWLDNDLTVFSGGTPAGGHSSVCKKLYAKRQT